jgi:hypothetical protein
MAAAPASPTEVEPVSQSNPGDAASAIRDCEVERFKDMVAGMGRVEHARDLPDYVPLTGREPEIATDTEAWAVTFRGDLPLGLQGRGGGAGEWSLRDPTCVWIGGVRSFLETGGTVWWDGEARSPGNGVSDPGGLPPLQP